LASETQTVGLSAVTGPTMTVTRTTPTHLAAAGERIAGAVVCQTAVRNPPVGKAREIGAAVNRGTSILRQTVAPGESRAAPAPMASSTEATTWHEALPVVARPQNVAATIVARGGITTLAIQTGEAGDSVTDLTGTGATPMAAAAPASQGIMDLPGASNPDGIMGCAAAITVTEASTAAAATGPATASTMVPVDTDPSVTAGAGTTTRALAVGPGTATFGPESAGTVHTGTDRSRTHTMNDGAGRHGRSQRCSLA
jgi:hypothetical protein